MTVRSVPRLAFCLVLAITPAAFADTPARAAPVAAAPGAVIERLGVPGPINFAGRRFALAWSSNPDGHLYKQEYVPAGQQVETFRDMMVIDVRHGTAGARETAKAMADSLEQRKATDPVARFELLEENGGKGMLLDFLMSARDAQGQVIIEWNAYRYADTPDGRGTTMIGISRRAYGDAQAREFLAALKTQRVRDRDALAALVVPVKVPPLK